MHATHLLSSACCTSQSTLTLQVSDLEFALAGQPSSHLVQLLCWVQATQEPVLVPWGLQQELFKTKAGHNASCQRDVETLCSAAAFHQEGKEALMGPVQVFCIQHL